MTYWTAVSKQTVNRKEYFHSRGGRSLILWLRVRSSSEKFFSAKKTCGARFRGLQTPLFVNLCFTAKNQTLRAYRVYISRLLRRHRHLLLK